MINKKEVSIKLSKTERPKDKIFSNAFARATFLGLGLLLVVRNIHRIKKTGEQLMMDYHDPKEL